MFAQAENVRPFELPPFALPEPTWTRSDNDLLPKWIKFLQNHQAQYRAGEIKKAEDLVWKNEDIIKNYPGILEEEKSALAKYKERLAELLEGEPTDEHIMTMYEALYTSPHVVGTRIDNMGGLVVLVDPQIEGKEAFDFGMYEVSASFFYNAAVSVVHRADVLHHPLREMRLVPNYKYAGNFAWLEFELYEGRDKVIEAMNQYNVEGAIDQLIAFIQRLASYYPHVGAEKSGNRADQQPWSGYVADPLRAMKRLRAASGTATHEELVQYAKNEVDRAERIIQSYLDAIRVARKEVRESKVELAKLKAQLDGQRVDTREAKRSLKFISTLPGVIAIKFREDGIPVLHVRTSFEHNGHRYDLGDFELNLKIEHQYFGKVLAVRRTRVPLAGSYEAGWHSDAQGFCFGGARTREIYDAFTSGDVGHAVNLALGTMNSVNEEHKEYPTRMFAEIPLNAVWKRTFRQRARRKPRNLAVKMGVAALQAVGTLPVIEMAEEE